MTNITTAERERRRLRAIAWTIALLFHVALLVAVVSITPLRQSVLSMNEEEIQEVARRERDAAERHRQRETQRQQQAVPEQFREDFKQELEQRRRGELRESVKALREVREQMEQQQEKTFEQLRAFAVERSPEDLEELFDGIHINVRRARISAEDMEALALETRKHISYARDEAEALRADVRDDEQRQRTGDASRKVAELAEQFIEGLHRDAEQKREAARALDEAVQAAAEELEDEGELPDDVQERKERAERLRESAKINRSVADNIQQRVDKLKPSAELVGKSARAAADSAVPEEAVLPPEAGTPADDDAIARQSADELYDTARHLEKEIDRRYRDTRSAQRTMVERSWFEEARERVDAIPSPERPNLSEAIAKAELQTLGDASQLRAMLSDAVNQTQLMQSHTRQQLAQVDPEARERGTDIKNAPAMNNASAADRHSASRSPRPSSGSTTAGSEGDDPTEVSDDELSKEAAAAKALPGRRFTDDAARRGWLYIDTWYIIGPWDLETHRRTPLPPEYEINLDATYGNGKTGRTWHPRLERHYQLTGKLKWQFVQSESLYIRPPNESQDAIYYAYTEVYSDRERTVLCAIDIDDRSKLWVNDDEVWAGTVDAWTFGQNTREFTLDPGFNKLLIRMENGAPLMDFSLVLLATD